MKSVIFACLVASLCLGSAIAQEPGSSAVLAPAQGCLNYEDYLHWSGKVALPGYTHNVASDNDYAYVTTLGGLYVVDMTSDDSSQILGSVGTPGSAGAVAVSGSYAYVLDYIHNNNALLAIDITNPVSPWIANTVPIPDLGNGLTIVEDYIFVSNFDAGLLVLEISEPGAPQIVASQSLPGSALGISVSDGFAYVVGLGGCGLQIVDVTVPDAPNVVGSLPVSGAWSVAVKDNYAYVASPENLMVVDVSIPESPQVVAQAYISGDMPTVAISGNYAFVASGPGPVPPGDLYPEFCIFDVSVPDAPERLSSLRMFGQGIGLSGNRAFVTGGYGGLNIIDITVPYSAPLVGSFWSVSQTGEEYRTSAIDVSDDYAYIGFSSLEPWNFPPHLKVVDFTDPTSPEIIGSVNTPPMVSDVELEGDFVYIAGMEYGLIIVDVSVPSAPQAVGEITYGYTQALAVDVLDNIAAVTLSYDGLWIVDVSEPGAPITLGAIDPGGEASDVALSGSYAFLANGSHGLEVVDLSDPSLPTIVATNSMAYGARSIALSGDYAFVTGNNGLLVVDISNPLSPEIVQEIGTPNLASNVLITENHAYISSGNGYESFGDALVYNIQDPLSPWVEGTIPTGSSFQAAALNDYILIAAGYNGLQIAERQCGEPVSGVEETEESPPGLSILRTYPNPFNPQTTISFFNDKSQHVRVEVYDIRGRRIAELTDQQYQVGEHSVEWRGRDSSGRAVPSGEYFFRVEIGDRVETRKAMLLR